LIFGLDPALKNGYRAPVQSSPFLAPSGSRNYRQYSLHLHTENGQAEWGWKIRGW